MSVLLARHRPDDPVCFGSSGARDAAQLVAFARAIGDALADLPKGTRVVLACGDRYCFSAALVAIWQRGLVAALPSNGQNETVHALARAAGVGALLHDRSEDVGIDVRAFEQPSTRAKLPLELGLTRDHQALVAFTSGSTGTPVAHEKTLAQLLDETDELIETFALTGRRVVSAVPPHHIYGLLFGVLMPLLGGGSMSRTTPLLPSELLHELERAKADVLVAVPPHLRALSEHRALSWPALHRVFSSAAPLAEATDRALAQHGLVVTQVLGSTETGGIAYRTSCAAPWAPLPSVQVSVASDAALCVDSPWLAPGSPRPFRAADRIELVAAGFRHLGRADSVVKVGGRRIDLGDAEARLRQVPGVRDARVLANETAGVRGVELWAVVEADEISVETLKRALSEHLDPVTMPRRFRVVTALPRSAAGKVQKRDLLALFDVWTFAREELEDGKVRVPVPHNSGFFRGHFDDQPILPGVVQLEHIALREAKRRWPDLGSVSRVTRVKFKRPIVPGDELFLSLERRGEAQVQFSMRAGTELASSGVLHFRGASK